MTTPPTKATAKAALREPLTGDALVAHAVTSLLLPYQVRWLADRSRYKIGNWSRQVGKSFVLTMEAVAQADTTRHNQLLFSASERQALENMEKVRRHLEYLQRVIDHQPPGLRRRVLSPRDTGSKEEALLANGARILAMPANPRTVRGNSGDVFWDEAALTQHDDEFWRAIFPIATRSNFAVRITSTPMGDQGVFHERWFDQTGRWSRHQVTLPEAVAHGLRIDQQAIRESVDEETWRQEYLCEFLSDAASYFPWELLKAAAQIFSDERDGNYRRTMGIDLGRVRDRTAIYDAVDRPGGVRQLELVEVLHQVPFEEQERRVRSLLARPGVTRCCIDATWNSMFAERLRLDLGPLVEPVVFSGPVKEELVLQSKRRFENGTLALDGSDRDLLNDFHAIRRYVTPANNVRFDADRNERGHADRAWAAMLAVHAAAERGDWGVEYVSDGPSLRRARLDASEGELEQAATGAFWDSLRQQGHLGW